jgi:caa(3)-type oxidase subunit IV
MIDLGRLNVVVALVIATIKALLVVLFFMHIYWSSKLNKLVVVSGVAWLALLLWRHNRRLLARLAAISGKIVRAIRKTSLVRLQLH